MAAIASKKSVRNYQSCQSSIIRSRERIKKTAEVFTPDSLLNKMTAMLPEDSWTDPLKTFIEPCCGNGNIVLYIIRKRIEHGVDWRLAIGTTYGVELMEDNVLECRQRIKDFLKDYVNDYDETIADYILKVNIVCSDIFKWNLEEWLPKNLKFSDVCCGLVSIHVDDNYELEIFIDRMLSPIRVEAKKKGYAERIIAD